MSTNYRQLEHDIQSNKKHITFIANGLTTIQTQLEALSELQKKIVSIEDEFHNDMKKKQRLMEHDKQRYDEVCVAWPN